MKNKIISFMLLFFLLIVGTNFISSASWSSNLNDGLLEYWNFELNSSTFAIGQLENHNLTLYNNPLWISNGKNGNGMNFTLLSNSWAKTFNNITSNNTDLTVNGWIKLQSVVDFAGIFEIGTNSTEDFQKCTVYNELDGQDFFTFSCNGTAFNSEIHASTNVGEWLMMTLVYKIINSTVMNTSLYINSTLVSTSGYWGKIYQGPFLLMTRYDSYAYTDGLTDEFAIWNRSLNQIEINKLYDNGLGTFYSLAPILPEQFLTIPNFTMSYNENLIINFSDYINNSDYVNISFIDYLPPLLQSLIPNYMSGNDNSTKYYLGNYFNVINNLLSLNINSYNQNRTIEITPITCNYYGDCINLNQFSIFISSSAEAENITVGMLVKTSNWMERFIPLAENITLLQRMVIVIVVLFIVSILAYLGLNYINVESPTSSYIVGVIDFFLIVLFTSLGYLKIWYFLIIIAIIIAISYLFRSRT